jgi:DNA-binding response OmpR family regulator
MNGEILIVDENPGVQRSLKRFLSQNGYSVVTTDNVQNAVHLINQSPPSLIILDVKMPRGDGIKLIHLLKENGYPLPIIVMTAYPTLFTQEEALKNGVSAYVTKPFDSAEMLRYIHQHLKTLQKSEKRYMERGDAQ